MEVTRRPARRPPSFEREARAAPKDYHELASGAHIGRGVDRGRDRPLSGLPPRPDRRAGARSSGAKGRRGGSWVGVYGRWRGSATSTSRSSNAGRHRRADGPACVREIREATKALNPIKTKLRAFEGMKVSVPGGRVAIGVSKEAVYGYAIFVDRGVWNRLDEETQDACVDAGLITLKGAAAASVALTVRDIGEAPPVPRKRAAGAKPRRRASSRPSCGPSAASRTTSEARASIPSCIDISLGRLRCRTARPSCAARP